MTRLCCIVSHDCHVISPITQLGKLPAKYSQYFEDSELNNKLLHQLPRKLRKSFVHAGYVCAEMIHSPYVHVYMVSMATTFSRVNNQVN